MGALINRNEKMLFIHNKKCGGTSIRNILQKNGFEIYKKPNVRYTKEIKKRWLNSEIGLLDYLELDVIDVNDYYTFTNIRDPYDRFASFYQSYRNGNENLTKFIERFLGCRTKDAQSIEGRPALSYHGDPYSPNLKCDFIIRLNHIDEDWENLKKETGIVGNIPHLHKKSYNRKTKTNGHLVDFVNKFYELDVKNYNKLNE